MRKSIRNHTRTILIIILSYLSSLSVGHIVSLNGNPAVFYGGTYYGYNITSILVFALTAYLLNKLCKIYTRRLLIFSCGLGFLISLLIVYGAYAHLINDIFIDTPTVFLQFGCSIGLSFLLIPLLAQFFLLWDKCESTFVLNPSKKFSKIPDWAVFLIYWTVIFLCFLPMFLSHWPGNFIFDAKYQIIDGIRGTHSTHHPLAHTLLMCWAYNLGLANGNASWGFQFYTIIQMIVLSGSFAFCCFYLYQKEVPRWLQIIAFLWFAIFPVNALFTITATKDVLFAAFFLFFFIFCIRFFLDHEETWYCLLGICAFGTLAALYRNNALYAILIAFLASIALCKTWKKRGLILTSLIIIYASSNLINQGLINYANATQPDTYRETFPAPLQCLARVAAYKGDTITDELKSEIYLYIPEYRISDYNPYNADPIKEFANENLLRSNTFNFVKLWAKVGLKYPDEYLEHLITNTLGYWYPLHQGVYVSTDIALYHTLIEIGPEIEPQNYCDWANKLYMPFWSLEYRHIPILGYLFRNAPYVWMTILSFFAAWYKKDSSKVSVLLLPFLYILTCFAGPLAALRYIYCIVIITPLIIYLALKERGS